MFIIFFIKYFKYSAIRKDKNYNDTQFCSEMLKNGLCVLYDEKYCPF